MMTDAEIQQIETSNEYLTLCAEWKTICAATTAANIKKDRAHDALDLAIEAYDAAYSANLGMPENEIDQNASPIVRDALLRTARQKLAFMRYPGARNAHNAAEYDIRESALIASIRAEIDARKAKSAAWAAHRAAKSEAEESEADQSEILDKMTKMLPETSQSRCLRLARDAWNAQEQKLSDAWFCGDGGAAYRAAQATALPRSHFEKMVWG